jgi:hypothetical protein
MHRLAAPVIPAQSQHPNERAHAAATRIHTNEHS